MWFVLSPFSDFRLLECQFVRLFLQRAPFSELEHFRFGDLIDFRNQFDWFLSGNLKMTNIRYQIFFEAGKTHSRRKTVLWDQISRISDLTKYEKSEIRIFFVCQNRFESWKSVLDRFSQIRTLKFGFGNEKSQVFFERLGHFSFGSDFFKFMGPEKVWTFPNFSDPGFVTLVQTKFGRILDLD